MMNEYSFFIPLTLALLLGVISPGPSFFIVCHTALFKNRKSAVFVSLGLACGAGILSLCAAFGLYFVLKNSEALYLILKVFASLYLIFLSYKIYKSAKKENRKIVESVNKKNLLKCFFQGLLIQLSNAKTIILLGSFFAAFLPVNASIQIYLILSLLVFFLDAIWYILVSFILSNKKSQNAFLKYQRKITYATSLILLFISFKLLLS